MRARFRILEAKANLFIFFLFLLFTGGPIQGIMKNNKGAMNVSDNLRETHACFFPSLFEKLVLFVGQGKAIKVHSWMDDYKFCFLHACIFESNSEANK